MLRTALFTAALLASGPAFAQSQAGDMPDPNDRSNNFTVALGAGMIPDYEGSNDYRLIPAAAIRGQVGGISFWTAGLKLYADLLARPETGIDFDLGPIVGVRLNRTRKVKDDFVDRLPERDTAVEVGAFGGISLHGVTNPYDSLSFRLDYLTDVGGAHGSHLVTPSVSFSTPLSRTFYISTSLSAEWAGDGYADYYYSISPADSFASGLPVFEADGGFKEWKLGLTAVQSLSGDLRKGWGVFGTASYSHLGGDFKDSPIVDDRGSASQWMAALGVSYSF